MNTFEEIEHMSQEEKDEIYRRAGHNMIKFVLVKAAIFIGIVVFTSKWRRKEK